MIESIAISNFRSILDQRIDLQPLTVIIGPNSSGKSNLIKAIEFIADAVDDGLNNAVSARGGFEELVPKKFAKWRPIQPAFDIRITLPAPPNWSDEYPVVKAEYRFKLSSDFAQPRVKEEELVFNEFLLVSQHLGSRLPHIRSKLPKESGELPRSSMRVYRNEKGTLSVDLSPEADESNFAVFLNWFGLLNSMAGDLKKEKLTERRDQMKKDIEAIVNIRRSPKKIWRRNELMFDSNYFALNRAEHFATIRAVLADMNRFDFLLHNLRTEQKLSFGVGVRKDGSNIPSILKLVKDTDKEAWGRIERTISNISPYFHSARHRTMKGGKEFVALYEIFKGREIESWEAADGVLRMLAMLLALETADESAVVMIEEPENGLHPWAIDALLSHIREVMERKRMQVIMTSHSTELLNSVRPEEVLVADRNAAGGTEFKSISQMFPDRKIEMTEVGRLWRKGLLHGVPVHKYE